MADGNSIDPELNLAQSNLENAEQVLSQLIKGRDTGGRFVSKKSAPKLKADAQKQISKIKKRIASINEKNAIYAAKQEKEASKLSERIRTDRNKHMVKVAKMQLIAAAKAQKEAAKAAVRVEKEKAKAAVRVEKEKAKATKKPATSKPVSPAPAPARSAPSPSAATATAEPMGGLKKPTGGDDGKDVEIAQQIGLLEALVKQRKQEGFETTDLEKYVVGIGKDNKGVRSIVEDFISKNGDKFDQEDPAGSAAFELMEEAVSISEMSVDASHDEAKKIYARLKFLRGLAKKTIGDQKGVADKLDSVLDPIEKQLKKKTSFSEFLKGKAKNFTKSVPERLAGKIPIVGGVLSEFLSNKRKSKEELEDYTTVLQRQIARKGARGEGLFSGRRRRTGLADIGGTAASAFPGLISGGGEESGGGGSLIPMPHGGSSDKSFGELVRIRKLISKIAKKLGVKSTDSGEGRFDKTGKSEDGGTEKKPSSVMGGMLSKIKGLFGFGKADPVTGKKPSSMMEMLGDSAVGTAAGMVGKSAVGKLAKGFLKKPVVAIKGLARSAGGLAKGLAGKAGGMLKGAGVVAGKAGGFFSGLAGKAGGMLEGAGSLLGKLNPAKAFSSAFKAIPLGKIIKGIVSIPGLGAIINLGMGALDIASIKNDPELTPEQKKDKIGKSILGTLGEAIGSVGGGALGSLIPIPGLGTLVGTLGGSWIGGKLAELLGDAIGGKGIYDMVSSIPLVGDLIKVDEGEQKELTDREKYPMAGAEGQKDLLVAGKLSSPASGNTTAAKMIGNVKAEQDAVNQMRFPMPPTKNTNTTSNIKSSVNTTNNNFNDDLRIRNNEPTIKGMQRSAVGQL